MQLYNWNETSGDLSNWSLLPDELAMVNPDNSLEKKRQIYGSAASPVPGDNVASSVATAPKSPPGKPTAGMTALRPDFVPGDKDVICARGKAAKDHAGNVWFRNLIEDHIQEYSECETKLDKSFLVSKIIKIVRKASPDGGFIKCFNRQWYEVGGRLSREKIGQTFRDMLHTQYRSSTKAKANLRRKRASATRALKQGILQPRPVLQARNSFRSRNADPPSKARRLDEKQSKMPASLPSSGHASEHLARTGQANPSRNSNQPGGISAATGPSSEIFPSIANPAASRSFPPLPNLQSRSGLSSSNNPGMFYEHQRQLQQQLMQQQQQQQHLVHQHLVQQQQHLMQRYHQQQQDTLGLSANTDVFRRGSINANQGSFGRRTSLGPILFNETLGEEPLPSISELAPSAVREMFHGQLFDSEITFDSTCSESKQEPYDDSGRDTK